MLPLAHVFYALGLLASYVLLLGSSGIAAGSIVLAVWAFVFSCSDRRKALGIVVAIAVLGCCWWIMALSVTTPREATRRSTCKNNLKQLGLALYNYHDNHGSFPPAYLADENGKPLLSWRVLLLPYIDQEPLYEAFDLTDPWDSPENLELQKKTPDIFACPSHYPYPQKASSISCLAVMGPKTCWADAGSMKFKDIKDGTSNVILLIEHHSDIPWAEPRDLTLEEAVDVLASTDMETFAGHRGETFFFEYFSGRHVLLADGSVRFAPFGIDRTLAKELLTIDDGRPAPDWDLVGAEPVRRTKWGNVIRFAVAAILTLLPLPWVWIHPEGRSPSPEASADVPPAAE